MHIKALVCTAALAAGGLFVVFKPAPAEAPKAKGGAVPLVSVVQVRTGDLPLTLSAQGHVTPLSQVEVRPEVTAVVRVVHFQEGEQVRAGQLLFTLDSSDSAAMLERARAQADDIRAQLKEAQLAHARTRSMVDAGYMAPSAIDTQTSKVAGLTAQLAAAQADIANAKVQLGRTRIVAPASGRTGIVNGDPGSLAQLGQTAPLVNIVQLDPIAVEFELPERYLTALRAAGVSVEVQDLGGALRRGQLTFINSTVNTASGTILLKASFANPDHTLWPGAFVRVALTAGRDQNVAQLPPQSVLEGPDGRFVYLLDAGSHVVARPVTLLRVWNEDAVVRGLKDGEQVVVEGAQDLHAGALVRTATAATTAAPTAATLAAVPATAAATATTAPAAQLVAVAGARP